MFLCTVWISEIHALSVIFGNSAAAAAAAAAGALPGWGCHTACKGDASHALLTSASENDERACERYRKRVAVSSWSPSTKSESVSAARKPEGVGSSAPGRPGALAGIEMITCLGTPGLTGCC